MYNEEYPNDEWTRLRAVIEWKGMSINYFARFIGLPNSALLYAIKRRNDRSHFMPDLSRLADLIVRACPEIDREWLVMGDGQMFREGYGNDAKIYYCDTK